MDLQYGGTEGGQINVQVLCIMRAIYRMELGDNLIHCFGTNSCQIQTTLIRKIYPP